MLEIRKEMNLKKSYETFIDYIDVSQKTVESYKNGIQSLLDYFNENNITNPTRMDIRNYRDELLRTHAANTVNSYMTAIREFFKYLDTYNLYENIAQDIKGAKISYVPKKQVLSQEAVQNIYGSLTDKREKALFGLLITTGLRGIEVVGAEFEDIKEHNGEITLWIQCKGHVEKDEYVKLSSQVYQDILDYSEGRNSGFIFVGNGNNNRNKKLTTKTIRLIIKNIFKRFGLDSDTLSLHSTRRTFASLAYQSGSDIYAIQQVLHHKSINTTTIYLRSYDRDNNNSELKVANMLGGINNAL